MTTFVSEINANRSSQASVTIKQFDHSRHAMAIIDYPEEYKSAHVNHLFTTFTELTTYNAQEKEKNP